jgi:hypothetical protein
MCPVHELLGQSIKKAAGPRAAPLLTRISFDGRSPQAGWQNIDKILTKNAKHEQIHINKIQQSVFGRKQKPRGMPISRQGLANFKNKHCLHFSIFQDRIFARAN